MVALGGSAQVSLAERSNVRSAMATSPASSVNQTTNTPTPPYLQPLLDELDNLRTASENIRTNARDLFNSLAFSTCVWLMLAIIPPMWSRVSYFIPLMSLVWLFGSGSLVKLYAMRMARPARAASIIQHLSKQLKLHGFRKFTSRRACTLSNCPASADAKMTSLKISTWDARSNRKSFGSATCQQPQGQGGGGVTSRLVHSYSAMPTKY
eukprot:773471-Pleurochrysis_carterae.AAC.1